MKRLMMGLLAMAVLGAALPGCRSAEERKAAREADVARQDAALKASIPADSPLAKLKLGMTEGEVVAILGPQNSQDAHTTGKQFIPFNFAGKDVLRTTYYYKGIGRVEFSSGSWGQRNGVIMLYADPSEPGYRRSE